MPIGGAVRRRSQVLCGRPLHCSKEQLRTREIRI